MKNPKTIFLPLLLFILISSDIKRNSSPRNQSHSLKREQAYFSNNHKLLKQYRLDSNENICGQMNQPSIILYAYNGNQQLTKVTFLDKDSILCSNLAYTLYKYDTLGRIAAEQSYNHKNQNAKFTYPIKYNYNDEGVLISKIREGKTNRSPYSNPGMIKYLYDDENRIIKEEYFNSEGKTASVNEMGIQEISYEYNAKGQLIKEIHFYSGTIDPEAKPKYRWEHSYTYGSNEEVIKCDVIWDFFDEKNEYSTFFKYDLEKNLYGVGQDSSEIELILPFEKIENVVYQEIYSNDYYPYVKRPKF